VSSALPHETKDIGLTATQVGSGHLEWLVYARCFANGDDIRLHVFLCSRCKNVATFTISLLYPNLHVTCRERKQKW